MRQTSAAIAAIVAIVVIAFCTVDGVALAGLGPANVGGSAIATETATVTPMRSVPRAPNTVLVANSGYVHEYDTLVVTGNMFTFPAGEAQTLTLELQGSENEAVTFRMQHVPAPDTFAPNGGLVLLTKRGPTGAAYASVPASALQSGWNVFTAQDDARTKSFALFVK